MIDSHIQTTGTYSRKISDADVALFALVTGDQHPLHLDDDYAMQTVFTQRVVPVSLIIGIVEAGLSHELEWTIGLVQMKSFCSTIPVYINDELMVTYQVNSDTNDAQQRCHIIVQRQGNEIVLECEMVLLSETGNTDHWFIRSNINES